MYINQSKVVKTTIFLKLECKRLQQNGEDHEPIEDCYPE